MDIVSQSPSDPAFVESPYAFYRTARALGDFVFWRDYGIPVATTSTAVNAVLRHPKMGREVPDTKRSAAKAHLAAFNAIEAHSLLELEPPEHTRLRKLVIAPFTRSRIQAIAPDISRIADSLIDGFPGGPFDLIEAYAQFVPALVIADLIGVHRDMVGQLVAWSHDMVAMYQTRRDDTIERTANRASKEFSEYVRSLIGERRKRPGEDLLSVLVSQDADGKKLTTDEIVSTTILMLNAGHEATVHAIGNAVRHLAGFSERKLALQPEHIAGTVEECIRFDPPLHMFRRHVYEDVTVLGQTFSTGDEIGCLLGSACRDDAVWPDGEIFDPFRLKRPNVAFGAGIHFCIDSPLAQLEMQIALPALFSRCPNLRIVEPPKVAKLYHFRGLERLMVEV